jgi:predicted nucleotidyltransferase
LLNFSQRNELGLHAAVIAEVQAAAAAPGVDPLIVGAFARDLHLVYAHNIPVLRQTEDVDLALAVRDWAAFEQLRTRLIATGNFAESKAVQRLRHRHLPVDLVPFGTVESTDRKIAWPPKGEVVMDVFGFREAQQAALVVMLPGGVQARVVSLPALALLKLVCWQDRHLTSPKKDAADLQLIITNYLQAGNENRLWDEFLQWTQEDEFDYETAGARMLGRDIATLLDAGGRERIADLLLAQSNEEDAAPLSLEMNRADPEKARRLLAAILMGLKGAAK